MASVLKCDFRKVQCNLQLLFYWPFQLIICFNFSLEFVSMLWSVVVVTCTDYSWNVSNVVNKSRYVHYIRLKQMNYFRIVHFTGFLTAGIENDEVPFNRNDDIKSIFWFIFLYYYFEFTPNLIHLKSIQMSFVIGTSTFWFIVMSSGCQNLNYSSVQFSWDFKTLEPHSFHLI